MNDEKAYQNDVREAWEKVGKAVNSVTELYLKEVDDYLGRIVNVRHEVLEQALAASRELSRMGETQFAFLMQMRKNFPLFGFGGIATETSSAKASTTENGSGRAA